MNKPPETDFFTSEVSKVYDERNNKLAPIGDCMHFLISLILRDLPSHSRILCVGVGTGAEILTLSKTFPEWTFVGVDPSKPMLDVCRQRLSDAGVLGRCELLHGYIENVPVEKKFDAALSILVAHFIRQENKLNYFKEISNRLRTDGYMINTEISFDLNSEEFSSILRNWEGVQALMGATSESLTNLPRQLREMLSVIPPKETEKLIRQSGIELPVRFFQAFMICGWYGKKQVISKNKKSPVG